MLYDLKFLNTGEVFPPESEMERLDGYSRYEMERNGEPWQANNGYLERLMYVLSNYSLYDYQLYMYDSDAFASIVDKIKNVTVGRRPIIRLPEKEEINDVGEIVKTEDERQTELSKLLKEKNLFKKIRRIVEDMVVYGDIPVKLYTTEKGEKRVSLLSPSMWFPVVEKGESSEIRYNVIAWVAKNGDDVEKSELHVQVYDDIEETVTNRIFGISQYNGDRTVKCWKNRTVTGEGYKLGAERKGRSFDGFTTGVYSMETAKIMPITFCGRSNTPYGRSLFDRLESTIMEYYMRVSLKNVVLDKFSAPKLSGPHLMTPEDAQLPNYIELNAGENPPNYLVWDANMTAVENTISMLKNDLSNASGLGSLLDTSVFGDSQGYDALMIKLTPALQEAEGITEEIEDALSEIIAYLSDGLVQADEITIVWKTGVPESKNQIANTAKLHKETGWSQKRVNVVDYEMTPMEAQAEEERKRAETPQIPFGGTNADWEEGDED